MTSAISMGKPASILATNLVFTRPVVNMALPKAADNRVITGNMEQERPQRLRRDYAELLCVKRPEELMEVSRNFCPHQKQRFQEFACTVKPFAQLAPGEILASLWANSRRMEGIFSNSADLSRNKSAPAVKHSSRNSG